MLFLYRSDWIYVHCAVLLKSQTFCHLTNVCYFASVEMSSRIIQTNPGIDF